MMQTEIAPPIASFTLDLPLVGKRDYLQALALAGEGLDALLAQGEAVTARKPVIRRMACHGPAMGRVACSLYHGANPPGLRRAAAVVYLDSIDGPLRLLMHSTGKAGNRVPDTPLLPEFTPHGRLSGTTRLADAGDFSTVWQGLYVLAKGALQTVWPAGDPAHLVFLQALDANAALDPAIVAGEVQMSCRPIREYERDEGTVVALHVDFYQPRGDDYSATLMCAALKDAPW